ncbi:MAG: Asp-tRNA(Asn)/Glu-tRNA(Gln) amidotransferase subunit GatC [Candidatus Nanoarchaeia archaeon]
MQVDKELILRVAKNAKLTLTEEEINQFTFDFKDILNSFSILNEVDTKNTEPSLHPVPLKNNTREDTPTPCLTSEEIFSNTKHKKNNYFVGPKAL